MVGAGFFSSSGLKKSCLVILKLWYRVTHVFAGPLNPGAVLIVKSCGTNISANVTDFALNHKIDTLTYFL